MKVGIIRHQNAERERIDGEEVFAMVQFSMIMVHAHVTARHLAAETVRKTTAAWGLAFPVRPLRRSGLRRTVHLVNACTVLIIRLMHFMGIEVGRGQELVLVGMVSEAVEAVRTRSDRIDRSIGRFQDSQIFDASKR